MAASTGQTATDMPPRDNRPRVDKKAFGARLREARLSVSDQGLLVYPTRRSLADAIGVHEQSVYRWERGKTSPSAEEVAKLCAVLGVSQEHLLYADDQNQGYELSAMTDPQLKRLLERPEVQALPEKKRRAIVELLGDRPVDETNALASLRLMGVITHP